jgi:hypothetical protein
MKSLRCTLHGPFIDYQLTPVRKGVTVAVWKAFVQVYGPHPEAGYLHAPFILPLDLLSAAFPLIDSNSSQFLTLLHISKQPMDLSRWMNICKLKNLRALFVDTGHDPCGFDERVAKGWANHALESGAFRRLRSLGLATWSIDEVTGNSLIHLLQLPKLKVLRARGLPIHVHEEDYGWEVVRSVIARFTRRYYGHH